VRLVHHDQVAVLTDDARLHLVERVATLSAAVFQVGNGASDHGSGLSGQSPSPKATQEPSEQHSNITNFGLRLFVAPSGFSQKPDDGLNV
jgi:hypothetical protein